MDSARPLLKTISEGIKKPMKFDHGGYHPANTFYVYLETNNPDYLQEHGFGDNPAMQIKADTIYEAIDHVKRNMPEDAEMHSISAYETKKSKDGGIYAIGGMLEHGLMIGDTIINEYKDYGIIKDISGDFYVYDPNTGERKKIDGVVYEDIMFSGKKMIDDIDKSYMTRAGLMKDGGDIEKGNLEMIKSNVKEIKHHADELEDQLKSNPEIEAWVLAKADRASTALSDITHYLDGKKYALGGLTPGRWYRDNANVEYRFIGKVDNGPDKDRLLFTDGEKKMFKTLDEFGGVPKENKLFGFFAEGGELKVGDTGTIQKYDYNEFTGKIIEIRDSVNEIDLGKGIKGKEITTYATVIDKNGKEQFGVLLNKMASGGELKSKKNNLLKYLELFPNDAKSWNQATDELRDIARMSRMTYLELDEKDYPALDFKQLKTPAEWNTKSKSYIKEMYDRMSDKAKKEFLDNFEEIFNDKMASGGTIGEKLAQKFTKETGISSYDKVKFKNSQYNKGTYLVSRIWAPKDEHGMDPGLSIKLSQGNERQHFTVMDENGELTEMGQKLVKVIPRRPMSSQRETMASGGKLTDDAIESYIKNNMWNQKDKDQILSTKEYYDKKFDEYYDKASDKLKRVLDEHIKESKKNKIVLFRKANDINIENGEIIIHSETSSNKDGDYDLMTIYSKGNITHKFTMSPKREAALQEEYRLQDLRNAPIYRKAKKELRAKFPGLTFSFSNYGSQMNVIVNDVEINWFLKKGDNKILLAVRDGGKVRISKNIGDTEDPSEFVSIVSPYIEEYAIIE